MNNDTLKAMSLAGIVLICAIAGFYVYVTAHTEHSSTIVAMDTQCTEKGGVPIATLSGRVCFARSALIEVTP